jgi:hypothetical protein
MEALRLRVKDVDFAANQITVRSGKGEKDRVTMLPQSLYDDLRRHLARVKLLHEADCARGFGEVWLPYALSRKYPNAAREWAGSTSSPRRKSRREMTAKDAGITLATLRSRKRSSARYAAPVSQSPVDATPSATASPRTCSKTVTTSAQSKSCSDTRMFARRWFTRTSSIAVLAAFAARSISTDPAARHFARQPL